MAGRRSVSPTSMSIHESVDADDVARTLSDTRRAVMRMSSFLRKSSMRLRGMKRRSSALGTVGDEGGGLDLVDDDDLAEELTWLNVGAEEMRKEMENVGEEASLTIRFSAGSMNFPPIFRGASHEMGMSLSTIESVRDEDNEGDGSPREESSKGSHRQQKKGEESGADAGRVSSNSTSAVDLYFLRRSKNRHGLASAAAMARVALERMESLMDYTTSR